MVGEFPPRRTQIHGDLWQRSACYRSSLIYDSEGKQTRHMCSLTTATTSCSRFGDFCLGKDSDLEAFGISSKPLAHRVRGVNQNANPRGRVDIQYNHARHQSVGCNIQRERGGIISPMLGKQLLLLACGLGLCSRVTEVLHRGNDRPGKGLILPRIS